MKNCGYKIDKKKNYIVYYIPLKLNREHQIEFNFNYKTVEARTISANLKCKIMNMQELKAINEKVKELGWIE